MASNLLIFTILLRAASVGLAGTVVAVVAHVDRRIVVVFVQPQHFTDMTYAQDAHTSGALRDALQQCMREMGERYMPAGMRLEIKVTDIDLAGDFEPWRGSALTLRPNIMTARRRSPTYANANPV